MSKVFTYHTQVDGEDWIKSDLYDDRRIEDIKDPEGGSEISLPTAIPSPFARIDLVKTAFRNITKTSALKQEIINNNVLASIEDEKLVSDALDLAELLFNYDTLKPGELKVIVWDKEEALNALKNGTPKQHAYAKVLELYFNEDGASYNFAHLSKIYLIEYNHKIIGATSPVTLFFTTANDLSFAKRKLSQLNTLFDGNYTPLYKRDPEFQKFIYALYKANSILIQRMADLYAYLDKNLKILDKENPVLAKQINELNNESYSSYVDISHAGPGSIIEIFGIHYKKKNIAQVGDEVGTSDFVLKTAKYKGQKTPLALQNNFAKAYKYLSGNWDSKTQVPYENATPIEDRELPGLTGIKYPYVTVGDFLEPYLVKIIYPINKDKYFDGNLAGVQDAGYLLPVTKKFFDFFDPQDLISGTIGNKPMLELNAGVADSITVTLRLPLKHKPNEYIAFERTYKYDANKDTYSQDDKDRNYGVIVEQRFGVTIFPFIKLNNPAYYSYYRVQLIDSNRKGPVKNADYNLRFLNANDNAEVNITDKVYRRKKEIHGDTTKYFVLENEFDYIQLEVGDYKGIILPKWRQAVQGETQYSFAVDFGTTNTHIEYRVGNGPARPFEIESSDMQVASLIAPNATDLLLSKNAYALSGFIDQEFVPELIGGGAEFKFPQRTVIGESSSINSGRITYAMADFNIPFTYEKRHITEPDKLTPNLKWAKKEELNTKRVRAYFEKLIMLMRNKVILGGGDVVKTKLVWFYPSSMSYGRKNEMKSIWDELYNKYFNSSLSIEPIKTLDIAESFAPYFYYKDNKKLMGASRPVVSIDIGGGTTDVVVFQSGKPKILSSFKFAANSIFGDGFSFTGSAVNHTLTQKYTNIFEELFSANNLIEFTKILHGIKSNNRSEDINTFLLSIENSSKIKDKTLFSYNKMLSNDDNFKVIFLYFYSSIIYQVGKLLSDQNIDIPRYIAFSGTGSKILNIITSEVSLLNTLTVKLLESVLKSKLDSDGLEVVIERNIPKEITCKGGLISSQEELKNLNLISIKKNHIGLEQEGINEITYADLFDNKKYQDIIVSEVKDFHELFIQISSLLDFTEYFNVSRESIDLLKGNIDRDINGYLVEGAEFTLRQDDLPISEKISDTPFFYPIIANIQKMLNQLAK